MSGKMTQGGGFGGWAFYLKDDRSVFHYNAIGEAHQYQVRGDTQLTPGAHQLVADSPPMRPSPARPGPSC